MGIYVKWTSSDDELPETNEDKPMSDIVFGTAGPNVIGLFRHYRGKWQYCPPIKEWPEPKVRFWMYLPKGPNVSW